MTVDIDLAVGQTLPTLELELPAWRLVAYQGATWDFHRGHHDWEFARSVGEPAPYADGQLFGALMARLLTQWGGANCFVRSLSFRLKNMVRPGEAVRVSGVVEALQEHALVHIVSVTLTVTLPADGREIATGMASVEVPRADASGSLPPERVTL